MRALFYSPKGAGHVNPTLPLVRGLVERGHDVTYTLTTEWKERLEAIGCRFRNTASTPDGAFTTADFHPGAPFYRQLLPATAALLSSQRGLVEEARAAMPDVIVFDSCAPWGYAVAEILGVPGICAASTLLFDREETALQHGAPSERLDAKNLAALDEIERVWGVDFRDRDIGLFYGRENLVFSCEELNPTRSNVRGTFHFVGSTIAKGGGGDLDGDLAAYAHSGKRRIYLSMGTVVGGKQGLAQKFFAPFIDAFGAREGYELLISAGEPAFASFGSLLSSLPKNVTVRRSVPQTTVLAHTDVFITHMGANSMHESLLHGVPVVCVPHFGDQHQNAKRVVEQGAGILLPIGEISAARVTTEVERIESTPSFRENAARLSKSLRAKPGLAGALEIIEQRARAYDHTATPSTTHAHAPL